jgi:thiol-disulfide isomerase/thioredoxin
MLLKEKTINGLSVKEILKSKKPLVINFWGTWCPVCNQEVSTLSKLAKRDDIILLTIAVNSGANSDIKQYMQKKGINFLVINDNNSKLAKAFNISVFPTTVFLSSDRKNIIKDSGYTTQAGFLARIKLVEH